MVMSDILCIYMVEGSEEKAVQFTSLCIMNNKILQDRQRQTLPLSWLAA